MQERWINVYEGDTCETSDQGNKLVKIIGTTPRDESGDKNCDEAEGVLLPFDRGVVFTAAREEAGFHNSDSREDLQWRRQQNSQRVKELDSINKFIVLW